MVQTYFILRLSHPNFVAQDNVLIFEGILCFVHRIWWLIYPWKYEC